MDCKFAYRSEKEMVDILVCNLNKNNYIIDVEVPNMGQNVDLVAIKEKQVTCIEAKLNNWKRALEQCEAHELVADFIYIAIGTKKVSNALLEAAKEKGYGIIHCPRINGKYKVSLEAKQNDKYWLPQRKVFIKKFMGVKDGN